MLDLINSECDRIFTFEDPLEDIDVPNKHTKGAVCYTYPDEICPEFTATLQRLIISVKDILNASSPLVEDAKKLANILQVWG